MLDSFRKTRIGRGLFESMLTVTVLAIGISVASASGPEANQRVFGSADDAAAALVNALKTHDKAALKAVLGVSRDEALSSGDPVADRNDIETFLKNYKQMHRFANGPDGKYYLIVGAENWPMPFPLALDGSKWYFDTSYGEKELRYRRIGRDELSAIDVCREIIAAQNEYYNQTHDGQTHQYAAKLISAAGKQDGLYWRASDGVAPSPIGPLIATASEEGYRAAGKKRPQEYYGYLYKLLTAQGAGAPGGAKDYIEDGKMTGGVAILAYPAKYGTSGIMTFMAGLDGKVYQRDLGPQTASDAAQIVQFNPDESWHLVGAE